jgi:hypothetical protein
MLPKKKSRVFFEILDRTKNGGTWDQAIAESRLAIRRLQDSVSFFESQKAEGVPYPATSAGGHQPECI